MITEYEIVRIYKNRAGRVIVAHSLTTELAPYEGDFTYIFVSKRWQVYVNLAFSGDFSKKELKAISNKLIAVDFAKHECELLTYQDAAHAAQNFTYGSLKKDGK